MILVSEQSTSMCLLTSKRLPDLDLQIISFEIGPRVIDICTRLLLLLTEILLHSPVIRNIQTFRCHPLIFTFIVIFILIIKSNLSLVKWMHINKWQRLKVFCFIVLRLHLRNAYKCAPACPWKSTIMRLTLCFHCSTPFPPVSVCLVKSFTLLCMFILTSWCTHDIYFARIFPKISAKISLPDLLYMDSILVTRTGIRCDNDYSALWCLTISWSCVGFIHRTRCKSPPGFSSSS